MVPYVQPYSRCVCGNEIAQLPKNRAIHSSKTVSVISFSPWLAIVANFVG